MDHAPDAAQSSAADLRRTPVAEVMSAGVVAIRADCHLSVAVDRLIGTGLHQLVVVDVEGGVAGLVSHDQVTATWLGQRSHGPLHVRDAVEAAGVTIAPETTVQQAASLMVRHRLHALPVVGADGLLMGVLTRSDLVAVLAGPS
ncbi:MAG: CBS domain-containing protein [Nocardioidaceae bacterium]